MKYLITESQLDKAIFRYLDSQNFIQIRMVDIIYFVYTKYDKTAKIRYDEDSGWCGIYYELIEDISSFFSLDEFDSEQSIGRWVENTLKMGVSGTSKEPFL